MFYTYKLTVNVRSIDINFSSFLLHIGEGLFFTFVDELVVSDSWKTEDVCSEVFENINEETSVNKVILAYHNEDVRKINNKVLNEMLSLC